MASWSPAGTGSADHRGSQEHLLPSDLGTAVATSLRCMPPSSHPCLEAHSLACCNMLYLGLHLRPYGLLAAAPSRSCLQNAEDQMEQTLPVWARLISYRTIQDLPAERQGPDGANNTWASLAHLHCWGLGVKKMADYKHLNNNPTTHADSFPPGMVMENINLLRSSIEPPTHTHKIQVRWLKPERALKLLKVTSRFQTWATKRIVTRNQTERWQWEEQVWKGQEFGFGLN